MTVTNIDKSVWEDFDDTLRRFKRSRDEFEVSEHVDPTTGPGLHRLAGEVTIVDRKTGAKRVYQTGHGSSWTADFERDLEAKVF